MQFKSPYLSTETKIRMLQRWILVHSYIYYHQNNNIVSDVVYDNNAQQLIKLQAQNPDIKTNYSYAFKDFCSGTGFDLYSKLNKKHKLIIERDALLILSYANGKDKK